MPTPPLALAHGQPSDATRFSQSLEDLDPTAVAVKQQPALLSPRGPRPYTLQYYLSVAAISVPLPSAGRGCSGSYGCSRSRGMPAALPPPQRSLG